MGHVLKGQSVSKSEVLSSLGHPADWARDERKLEFCNRLVPGATELDLTGIKGSPGMPGYLGYLEKSFESPLGTGTSLVSAEANAAILETARAEIAQEMVKYQALLTVLEKDPEAITRHIAALRRRRSIATMFDTDDRVQDLDEESAELARYEALETARAVQAVDVEIKRYSELLGQLALVPQDVPSAVN